MSTADIHFADKPVHRQPVWWQEISLYMQLLWQYDSLKWHFADNSSDICSCRCCFVLASCQQIVLSAKCLVSKLVVSKLLGQQNGHHYTIGTLDMLQACDTCADMTYSVIVQCADCVVFPQNVHKAHTVKCETAKMWKMTMHSMQNMSISMVIVKICVKFTARVQLWLVLGLKWQYPGANPG